MKRSPIKRGTSQLARKPFKRAKPASKKKKPKKPTITLLKKKLWQECRRITREKHPHICYTCGKPLIYGTADFHTGHFIASSICSTHMRYHLDNLRPQCSGCNVWKSGNWIAFEAHLIIDGINPENLKKLNEETKGQSYRIDWYEFKIKEYDKI